MSSLEVKKINPNTTKLLTGGGDGIRNGLHPEKIHKGKIRQPVPSCRRFSTRPGLNQQDQTKKIKEQLQAAIKELATNPDITRRKALSMAEINPTRTLNQKRRNDMQTQSTSSIQKVNNSQISRKLEDARRRVYQLLLLNAWRQRRAQVATLSESVTILENQNGQHLVQIDALNRLRKAECDKRNEAVRVIQSIQHHLIECKRENENFAMEKEALINEVRVGEEYCSKLQINMQNLQNEFMTSKVDNHSLEQQLRVEREKIKEMREEKKILVDQLSDKEENILKLSNTIDDLQENLLNIDLTLQEAHISNSNYKNDIKELVQKLDNENASNDKLEKNIQDLLSTKDKLNSKIHDMRKSIQLNKEIKRNMEEENQILRKSLAEMTVTLTQERKRPWWRNAGELALAPLNVLQNAAYIMLPAFYRNQLPIQYHDDDT